LDAKFPILLVHCFNFPLFSLAMALSFPDSSRASSESIRRCITSGMFTNVAYLHYSGEYRTVRGDCPLAVHPSSVLYTLTQPKWWALYL